MVLLLIHGEHGLSSHVDNKMLASATPRVFKYSATGISGLILFFSKADLYYALIQRGKPLFPLPAKASVSDICKGM